MVQITFNIILLYKVVRFFTEPNGFSHLGKLHIGPVKVLGYFIKFYKGFKLFFYPISIPLNSEPLDARGEAASDTKYILSIVA